MKKHILLAAIAFIPATASAQYTAKLPTTCNPNSPGDCTRATAIVNPDGTFVSGGGGGGGTSNATSNQNYTATQAGTGYAIGDVIVRVVSSAPTGNSVAGAYWVNLTQGVILGTPPTLSSLTQLPSAVSSLGSAGTAYQQGPGVSGANAQNVYIGGQNANIGVQQPDVFGNGPINAGTAGSIIPIPLANAEGTLGLNFQGASTSVANGGTTVVETQDGPSAPWTVLSLLGPGGATYTSVPADGGYKINASAHYAIRVRQSVAASTASTITVYWIASTTNGVTAINSSLPAGANNIGSLTNITGTISLPSNASTASAQATSNATIGAPGTTAPTTGVQVGGTGPNGNYRVLATDTRGALQPAQLVYLNSTPVAIGTTAAQIDSDVTNSGSSVTMTTAQRSARIGVTVQVTVALTADVYLCLGNETTTCSATNYSYLLQSGLAKASIFIPIGAPGTPVYALGAAASAGTLKISSQIAF